MTKDALYQSVLCSQTVLTGNQSTQSMTRLYQAAPNTLC